MIFLCDIDKAKIRSGSLALVTVHTHAKDQVQHKIMLTEPTSQSKNNLQWRVQEYVGMQQRSQETSKLGNSFKAMQLIEQLIHG